MNFVDTVQGHCFCFLYFKNTSAHLRGITSLTFLLFGWTILSVQRISVLCVLPFPHLEEFVCAGWKFRHHVNKCRNRFCFFRKAAGKCCLGLLFREDQSCQNLLVKLCFPFLFNYPLFLYYAVLDPCASMLLSTHLISYECKDCWKQVGPV